jgi:hypothetical protein
MFRRTDGQTDRPSVYIFLPQDRTEYSAWNCRPVAIFPVVGLRYICIVSEVQERSEVDVMGYCYVSDDYIQWRHKFPSRADTADVRPSPIIMPINFQLLTFPWNWGHVFHEFEQREIYLWALYKGYFKKYDERCGFLHSLYFSVQPIVFMSSLITQIAAL